MIAPGNNGQLSFALAGRSRPLRHKGSLEFCPAGADNVRVVFDVGADGVVPRPCTIPTSCCAARKAVKQ